MNLQEELQPSVLEKIKKKKEFSQLSNKDIELAYSHFNRRDVAEEEKIRLTRELLHKVFSAFGSRKLLLNKERNSEWVLKKHISTRERYPYYEQLYKKILSKLGKKLSIIDLGAGVNGFSYDFFKKQGLDVNYLGIESVGQLVDITNLYFKQKHINGKLVHLSLFELKKIQKLISMMKKPRILFLFKVIDSLEMLEKNSSKKLLSSLFPLLDLLVVSFATESLVSRKKFYAKRKWLLDFLNKNFKIIDDFSFAGERYLVLKK